MDVTSLKTEKICWNKEIRSRGYFFFFMKSSFTDLNSWGVLTLPKKMHTLPPSIYHRTNLDGSIWRWKIVSHIHCHIEDHLNINPISIGQKRQPSQGIFVPLSDTFHVNVSWITSISQTAFLQIKGKHEGILFYLL